MVIHIIVTVVELFKFIVHTLESVEPTYLMINLNGHIVTLYGWTPETVTQASPW